MKKGAQNVETLKISSVQLFVFLLIMHFHFCSPQTPEKRVAMLNLQRTNKARPNLTLVVGTVLLLVNRFAGCLATAGPPLENGKKKHGINCVFFAQIAANQFHLLNNETFWGSAHVAFC